MSKLISLSAPIFVVVILIYAICMTVLFKWSGLYMSILPIGIGLVVLELFRIRQSIERNTEILLLGKREDHAA